MAAALLCSAGCLAPNEVRGGKGSGGCIIYVRWEGGLIPCEVGLEDTIDDLRRQLPPELQSRPLMNQGEAIVEGTMLADAGVGSQSVLECPMGGMHWDTEWGGELKEYMEVEKQTLRFEWDSGLSNATLFARLGPPAQRSTLPRVSATLTAHCSGVRFPESNYRVGFSMGSVSTDPASALGNHDGGYGLLASGGTYDSLGLGLEGGEQPARHDDIRFGKDDKVHVWLDAGEGKFFIQVESEGKDIKPPVLTMRWVPGDQPLWLTVCAYDPGVTEVVLEGAPPGAQPQCAANTPNEEHS
eukprot:Hpha_TRINITY_DN3051_c0_g1::TRINITY_DN3051_c0_g1_i1::g.138522::m.138522